MNETSSWGDWSCVFLMKATSLGVHRIKSIVIKLAEESISSLMCDLNPCGVEQSHILTIFALLPDSTIVVLWVYNINCNITGNIAWNLLVTMAQVGTRIRKVNFHLTPSWYKQLHTRQVVSLLPNLERSQVTNSTGYESITDVLCDAASVHHQRWNGRTKPPVLAGT